MEEPKYDKALDKWCVRYALATWWFDSYETAHDWYLLNKDKF